MAKKNESTAVNDLINLVATQGASVKDPGADLFAEPPKRSARMTATVPPMKGAGTVEPLPRGRAPHGTQQNMPSIPPPPMRVSTSLPAWQSPTIPSLGTASPIAPETSGRLTRPSLPPPTRQSGPVYARPSVESPLPTPDTPPAAENSFIAAPLAVPAQADITDQSWFQESRAVERSVFDEHTAQVERSASSTLDLAKKLALPMGIMIVIGVVVGGYFAFDGQGGQGGKKRAPKVAALAPAGGDGAKAGNETKPADSKADEPVEAKAVDEPVKAEPAVGAAATADADTDEAPVKEEPAKAASVAKAEPVAEEEPNIAKAEPVAEPVAKTDPVANSEPAVALPVPTHKGPVFVDVRIDSKPAGATVMLVDRGKTTFLGTTPIVTSVDPARSYDVVFTYAKRPTQLEHLDPKTMQHLEVRLGKKGNRAKETTLETKPATKPEVKAAQPTTKIAKAQKPEKAAKTEVALAKAAKPEKLVEPTPIKNPKPAKVKGTIVDAFADEPKAEAKVAKPSGNGVLMISSKPPCGIWVDGVATGLTTPQRAMSLPAGKHKVTLVSPDKKLKKTVTVEITPDKPTKVIQDLLK